MQALICICLQWRNSLAERQCVHRHDGSDMGDGCRPVDGHGVDQELHVHWHKP